MGKKKVASSRDMPNRDLANVELVAAAKEGSLEMVEKQLQEGAFVNYKQV